MQFNYISTCNLDPENHKHQKYKFCWKYHETVNLIAFEMDWQMHFFIKSILRNKNSKMRLTCKLSSGLTSLRMIFLCEVFSYFLNFSYCIFIKFSHFQILFLVQNHPLRVVLNPLSANPRNCQTHSNNSSVVSRQIV